MNYNFLMLNKVFRVFILATILSIVFSSNIQADSSKAKLKALRDLYELEVDMLESSIDLTKESKDLNKTISLYENLVELFCFYDNPNKSEEKSCESYSKKLSEIYPDSIYLKCLELKDINRCDKLFKEQVILTVSNFEELESNGFFEKENSWDRNQRFIDLRLKLEQFSTKENVEELNKEIKEINENLQYDETVAKDARASLRDKYRKAIPNACKQSNVYYSMNKIRDNDNFLAKKKVEIVIDKDLKVVGDSFLGLEKAKKEEKEKDRFTRIKLYTDSCIEILKSAYEFDKSIPEIHCFLKSFIVPKCKSSVGDRAYISNRAKTPSF